jgi:hypothetical protein
MTSEPHKSRHTGVNENEEFCCMFKSRLGSNAILFGAEMDGYQLNSNTEPKAKKADDLNLSSDGHFIEMKTSRLIENDRQHNTFCRFKTQKWWAQSFMVIRSSLSTFNIRNPDESSFRMVFFVRLSNGPVFERHSKTGQICPVFGC